MQWYEDLKSCSKVMICDCGVEVRIPHLWFVESNLLDVQCNKCGNIYMENGKECYKKGNKTLKQ
jgi:hypothetical protein